MNHFKLNDDGKKEFMFLRSLISLIFHFLTIFDIQKKGLKTWWAKTASFFVFEKKKLMIAICKKLFLLDPAFFFSYIRKKDIKKVMFVFAKKNKKKILLLRFHFLFSFLTIALKKSFLMGTIEHTFENIFWPNIMVIKAPPFFCMKKSAVKKCRFLFVFFKWNVMLK